MKKLLLKSMLLLFALIVGSGTMWAQSDYSATYVSDAGFSSVITGSSVTIGSTDYAAVKKGTSSSAGSLTISVPKDTKYLHLHAAGWNGESVTLSISPDSYSSTKTIALTADGNIKGSGTTYDVDDSKCATDYYKVITFTSALANNTSFTFTATSGKRFVIWGVKAEVESSDPSSEASFANTTPSISYPATKTYSQVPTTAIGYTGTISYSMTANTAGASINSTTGLVTVTKGGSVTVKAIAAAVPGTFSGSEASYTLTVNDTRTSAGLSWSAATANVTYGADNNVFPTLTNTHNVPITYSSSNQAAASIDENGVITLKDITADTDISAIFAGNDDYLAQTVTYTLKVAKAPFAIKDGVFDFVEAAEADEDYGSGITTTSSGSYYDTSDATWTAGNVTMVTSGKYRWWSSNTGCDLRFYNNTPRSSATFSVPDGYVITKIVTTNQSFDSANTGVLNGTTWTGASQSVKLSISTSTVTIKTITVTYSSTAPVTISSASGFATLFTDCPLDFSTLSSELKAYTATVSENTVTLTEVNDIPANTGVVLKGDVKTHNVPVAVSSSTAKGDLTGNTSAATAYNAYDGYDLYMLALNGEGKVQFTKATSGSIAAGKAFLKLSSSATARELNVVFADDDVTGVNTVNVERGVLNGDFFNLAGQRVAQPTKGLYIVNGKKVVIK